MISATLPEGYVDRDFGRRRIIAARLELDEMTALLEGPERLRPAGAAEQGVLGGRGGTRRIKLPGGKTVYLRHYLRGGLPRALTRDLFLLRPARPVRELVATETARAAGCPVPTVHAVCIEEVGPFYRGWIVTSAIEGTLPLVECLLGGSERSRSRLLSATGRLVRQLMEAGVYHVDLTGHNVLVHSDGHLSVIDFDRAVVGRSDLHVVAERSRDRLWRSLEKLWYQAGRRLDPTERRWLERGFRAAP